MKFEEKETTNRPTKTLVLKEDEYGCIEDVLELVHYENGVEVISLYSEQENRIFLPIEPWEMLIKQIRSLEKRFKPPEKRKNER